MKGLIIVFLCFVGGVFSQRTVIGGVDSLGGVLDRGIGVVDPLDRRGRISGGVLDRGIGVVDPPHRHGRIGGGVLDRGIGVVDPLNRRGRIGGGVRDRGIGVVDPLDWRGRIGGGVLDSGIGVVDPLDRRGRIGSGILDRGIGGLDPLDRRGSIVGGIDASGRFIGGGLDGIDRRGTPIGGVSGGTSLGGLSTSRVSGRICYRRGERPAYDRNGRVEWCNYRYNFCNAPGAVCRLSGLGQRRSGACCYRTGRRHPQQRDEHCRSGRAAAGYCRVRSTCPQGGIHYRCEFNRAGSPRAGYASGRRRGLCCETGGHPHQH